MMHYHVKTSNLTMKLKNILFFEAIITTKNSNLTISNHKRYWNRVYQFSATAVNQSHNRNRVFLKSHIRCIMFAAKIKGGIS